MLAHNSASRRQLPHHPQQPSYTQHGSIFNPSLPHQLPQLPQLPQQPHTPLLPQPQSQSQSQSLTAPTLTPHSAFTTNNLSNNNTFDFEGDQIIFDIQQPLSFTSNRFQQQTPLRTAEYSSDRIFQLPSHMQQPLQSNTLMSNGQLTPTSTSRQNHHRESSLSSFGSPAAPASPYAPSTLNPQVAGESYHDFQDFHPTASKTLTPAHTPLQENFFSSQYTHPSQYQNQNNLPFAMLNDGLPRLTGNELMSAPEIYHSQGSSRPSLTTVASNDSPSTPPACEDERQQFGMTSSVDSWLNEYLLSSDFKASHRTSPHQMPKLDRTMTDAYNDELFNPNISMISAPSTTPASTQTTSNLSNDIFTQRLQAANNGHLSTQREASVLSPRQRSPFQAGSPLAPTPGYNAHNMGFGTAKHMREQQKAEDDALAMQVQYERSNPGQVTPKTISPKDVNLVYNETEEDADNPLFPPPRPVQSKAGYRQQSSIDPEPSESEDLSLSQQSYASMATTRRESSSAISTTSQNTPTQSQFKSTSPIITRDNLRQIPQHYPFVPSTQRQASNISNMSNLSNISNDFTPTLGSMESSSSDYSPDQEIQRPCDTSAGSGTYTCTYHGCTLRFETPPQLQKHKRDKHRNSTSLINNMGGESRGAMTSMAQKLNSQSGPHKCERINPSTNKPCNTIFSRPYDLTRHEDTIHNAGKQKLRCKYCTEEKTFSRNDALTRHLRVVHPEIPATITKGKRRGLGLHSD
ncbi:hypothetical protein BELL_1157g00010 [Botrytis elliptica]|uniref:C2H2-type domain-containing protein n=1 Tax=Botrytis elliptica TaxID=278938 RepID=A0A4Z1IJC0_9HELO|nr:hypothetical protein EAE99_011790 [Botrytis elliptica]TGO61518.1 hypothetical protein BELL_1157g00010 [Botrytis elliptica]